MADIEDIWAHDAVAAGLGVLNLERLDDTRFRGGSLETPIGRTFGGQVLGQALMAAGRTVPEGRHAHSLHGYFLRPADSTQPIDFDVEVLRDGGSFSARRTHALQNGKPILSMIASFQQDQDGLEHSVAAPEVPGPDATTPGYAVYAPFEGHPAADFWLKRGPFDVRHVEGPMLVAPDAAPKAYQTVWMRVRETIEADELTHRALIAFGCDQVMLEPVLRRHSLTWLQSDFSFASLDHAMWWHRPARADEWLLFVQDTPTAQGGRGLTGAWVFTEDGRLVASIAQEGMFRAPTSSRRNGAAG